MHEKQEYFQWANQYKVVFPTGTVIVKNAEHFSSRSLTLLAHLTCNNTLQVLGKQAPLCK